MAESWFAAVMMMVIIFAMAVGLDEDRDTLQIAATRVFTDPVVGILFLCFLLTSDGKDAGALKVEVFICNRVENSVSPLPTGCLGSLTCSILGDPIQHEAHLGSHGSPLHR